MRQFKVIEASGTPYNIGFSHGSEGKEEVFRSIETYREMFLAASALTWDEAKERSRSYIPYIQTYDSEMLEELQGIADGAGVELEDILALNARSEVILMQGEPSTLTNGCTSLAVMPEATLGKETFLAQNWDWKGSQIEAMLVLKIKQENKPDITMVTEGGLIGKVGFNSAGIGVCLNALGTVGNPKGLPLHVILRGILNSETISDAISRINGFPNACAGNFLIASRSGEAINLEKSPVDFEAIYPTSGILVHSNHFLTDRLKSADTVRFLAHDSFLRYGIAQKILDAKKGRINQETIQSILKNHKDYPDSICRHEDSKDPVSDRKCTVFSIIMNMTTLEMWLICGNPCENTYSQV